MTTAVDRILEINRRYPCLYLQEIGDKVGVSRERVRQVLVKAGITERGKQKRGCFYTCNDCGILYRFNGQCSRNYCRDCYPKHRLDHWATLVCEVCGTDFRRRIHEVRAAFCKLGYEHIFCGKPCQGVWLGKRNHGRRRKSKYAHLLPQIEEMLKTKTKTQVARELGLPNNWFWTTYPNLVNPDKPAE